MGFSRKQQSSDMPPLIEEVKAGEPIVLDKEEQRAIDNFVKSHFPDLKDRIFPKDVAAAIVRGVGSEALEQLARRKLFAGDLKGAASTCVKSLGLSGGKDTDWLLLSEIFAQHRDIVRSRGFLDKAQEARKKNKKFLAKSLEKVKGKNEIQRAGDNIWDNEVQRVQDIIRSKQPK